MKKNIIAFILMSIIIVGVSWSGDRCCALIEQHREYKDEALLCQINGDIEYVLANNEQLKNEVLNVMGKRNFIRINCGNTEIVEYRNMNDAVDGMYEAMAETAAKWKYPSSLKYRSRSKNRELIIKINKDMSVESRYEFTK